MEQGKATCTGLAILLADACRSVGVPARLVGTPLWANERGNHTWVEIWDEKWHFTGACEADPKGLDRGWFVGDAAQAQEDSLLKAIYAASFKKTPVSFPLVWARNIKDVYAENVTSRYAKPKASTTNVTLVKIRVRKEGGKERLILPVEVVDRQDAARTFHGESRGETADTNDILGFELPTGREYLLRIGKPTRVEKTFQTTSAKEQLVDVAVPPDDKAGIPIHQMRQIDEAARAYFTADEAKQAAWKFDPTLDQLLVRHDAAVRQAVWQAYKSAPIHTAQHEDFTKQQVRSQQYLSPYKLKQVGARPPSGWPLFIAMHGGGGAPKEVNDSQWRMMQRYYKDQPSVTGYQYLALRAPNDTWNGFYADYVPPLVTSLIRQFLLFGDIDSDKVFLMGYSHGGYGAFFIGPKIPDRFAAIHSSAAAPTAGTISARTLRNTRFTFMVGSNDTAYSRLKFCEEFNEGVKKLKDENKDAFPVEFELKQGFGHGGLPDRDKIKEMYAYTRNPAPRRLSWELTDPVVTHFFWLGVPKPGPGQILDAVVQDNRVQVTTQKVERFTLNLDCRLVDVDKPLVIVCDGKTQTHGLQPRIATLCRSMIERGDPVLAYTCQLEVKK
jgi:Transglutaminase-like superfamily